ncbi:RNA polymerase sigma-70 factor, ECF subfamily [Frankia sp. AiPs1]|uniref:RNA polymerase sigma factor n=1 Tax=Frankia sp. AiPa1 TaxID=573492 RepID=UPI00202B67B7|nr:sigma-70 family RNA polymerase sigma factor [Frankia sp. AiPa1]MCL9760990.1 sigma-70 family RNA polymerase sigma factor [Frankia sp. AiPa1]
MEVRQSRTVGPAVDSADARLVRALRDGDEAAFARLVERWTPTMLAVANSCVPSRAVAEDVVQETWLAVLTGLHRFEGRSRLRTWVFSILVNIARSRGARERRSVPFSALSYDETAPTVAADRFLPSGDEWAGHWSAPPLAWDLPESAALSGEIRSRLRAALDALPARQRAVVQLRDVLGLDPGEVCELLGLEPGNQRVLLHRGRARLRQALEDYMNEART